LHDRDCIAWIQRRYKRTSGPASLIKTLYTPLLAARVQHDKDVRRQASNAGWLVKNIILRDDQIRLFHVLDEVAENIERNYIQLDLLGLDALSIVFTRWRRRCRLRHAAALCNRDRRKPE
jgi:hypothetical protein